MSGKQFPMTDAAYTPQVSKGFRNIFSSELIGDPNPGSLDVAEVQKILKKALGKESLYESIRRERDER